MRSQWIVSKDPSSDCYAFKNSRVPDRFLAPPPGATPGNNTALSGRVAAEAAVFHHPENPWHSTLQVSIRVIAYGDSCALAADSILPHFLRQERRETGAKYF